MVAGLERFLKFDSQWNLLNSRSLPIENSYALLNMFFEAIKTLMEKAKFDFEFLCFQFFQA